MNRDTLADFIKARLMSGPEHNKGDVAVKFYFYDVAPVILKDNKLESFLKPDGITIRKGQREPFVKYIIEEVGGFARMLCGDSDHLTIILYGIVTGKGRLHLDLYVSADTDGYSAGRLKTYKSFRRV